MDIKINGRKKMLKKLLMLPLAVFSLNGFAANPYTDCGIGAALFPNTPVAAVLSNVIWDAGTTAVISATVSEQTCSAGSVETAQLIHDKFEFLEADIMIGDGENLVALTETLGCDGSSDLNASIRTNMKSVLSDDDYASNSRVEKSIRLYEEFQSNEIISSSCSVII
tara:strand:- start:123 stop:623 length:501 start_codon:yes stop_codon:yes gene_type:complete